MRNEERQDGGWHLKREVQLGHIITTCTVLFSVIWYASKLEQRIALVEQSQMQVTLAQKERDDRQDKLASDALAMLRQQLDRLEQKLDRVIEGRK